MFKKILLAFALLTAPFFGQTVQTPTLQRNNTWSGNNTFNGTTTLGTTSAGAVTATSLATSASGVFTNTQMNQTVTDIINSLNTHTEFQAVQGSNNATEASTSGMSVPNTSTVFQSNAVAGYINNSSTTTNAVGGYFQARTGANSTKVWGINSVVADVASQTGTTIKNEIDCNANNTTTVGQCLQIAGSFGAQPTGSNFPAISITKPGSNQWTSGITVNTGAVVNGAAISLSPAATGSNQSSQLIDFNSVTSGGTGLTASIQSNPAGQFVVNPGQTGFAGLVVALGGGIQLNGSTSGQTVLTSVATASGTATLPANTGTIAEINLAQSWSGNQTNMPLVTPTIGGNTITNVPEISNSLFTPSVNGVGTLAPIIITSFPITITRFWLVNGTPPAGCGTFPVISVFDNGGSSIITSLTEANSVTVDSGALSIAVAAGKTLVLRTTTAAATCTTTAANVSLAMQYKMQ